MGLLFCACNCLAHRAESGRAVAALPVFRGNPLPLFWHCRFAATGKALKYGVLGLGT